MPTTSFTDGPTSLLERPDTRAGAPVDELADEFALDVRVIVALAPVGIAMCPTDDGCGNTCSGNDSSCNSFVDDPA
jgi:FxLD family lantipeptide